MSNTITIDLPLNLDDASIRQLDQVAREAVGVRLYRDERLSHKQLADFLHLDRWQTDAVLNKHNVTEDLPTIEEIREQAETSHQLRQSNQHQSLP